MKDKAKGDSVNDLRSEQSVERIKRKHGPKNRNVIFMLKMLIILFSLSQKCQSVKTVRYHFYRQKNLRHRRKTTKNVILCLERVNLKQSN